MHGIHSGDYRVWQQRNTKELGGRLVGKQVQAFAVVGRFDETSHLRRGPGLVQVPGSVITTCPVQTLVRGTLAVTRGLDCTYSLQK